MDAKSLADALLRATAQQDAAKASVDAYREALTDRFRRLHTEEGIRGRVDLDGLGNARWDTPDPEPVITDCPQFMAWASYLASTRLTFNGPAGVLAVSILKDAGIDFIEETILRDGDRDAILKDIQQTGHGIPATSDGEVVPGVEWRDKAPRLVVTVDSGLKTEQRRRAREAVIAEVADARPLRTMEVKPELGDT